MREQGREIVMIGHAGHPEVEGTMGQVDGGIHLVESVDDVARLSVRDPDRLAYVTQTTLSVDDAAAIVDALKARFPAIVGPKKRRHLLRDAEPAGRGEGDGAAGRRGDRRRQSQQLELEPPARGRRASRRARVDDRPRRGAASGVGRGQAARRRHGGRVGAGGARPAGHRATEGAGRDGRHRDHRRRRRRDVPDAEGIERGRPREGARGRAGRPTSANGAVQPATARAAPRGTTRARRRT